MPNFRLISSLVGLAKSIDDFSKKDTPSTNASDGNKNLMITSDDNKDKKVVIAEWLVKNDEWEEDVSEDATETGRQETYCESGPQKYTATVESSGGTYFNLKINGDKCGVVSSVGDESLEQVLKEFELDTWGEIQKKTESGLVEILKPYNYSEVLSQFSKNKVMSNKAIPFNKGDKVFHPKYGEGTVTYVGSGPQRDKVSVQFSNPVQTMLGPAIVSPNSLKKIDGDDYKKEANEHTGGLTGRMWRRRVFGKKSYESMEVEYEGKPYIVWHYGFPLVDIKNEETGEHVKFPRSDFHEYIRNGVIVIKNKDRRKFYSNLKSRNKVKAGKVDDEVYFHLHSIVPGIEPGDKLPSRTFNGDSIYYIDEHGHPICPKCANDPDWDGHIVKCAVNFDDIDLSCWNCVEDIPIYEFVPRRHYWARGSKGKGKSNVIYGKTGDGNKKDDLLPGDPSNLPKGTVEFSIPTKELMDILGMDSREAWEIASSDYEPYMLDDQEAANIAKTLGLEISDDMIEKVKEAHAQAERWAAEEEIAKAQFAAILQAMSAFKSKYHYEYIGIADASKNKKMTYKGVAKGIIDVAVDDLDCWFKVDMDFAHILGDLIAGYGQFTPMVDPTHDDTLFSLEGIKTHFHWVGDYAEIYGDYYHDAATVFKEKLKYDINIKFDINDIKQALTTLGVTFRKN